MGTPQPASPRATNPTPEWIQAHEALSRLARQRAALDADEGAWLLRAWRSAAHLHLGFASFAEYIERLFGYRPRTTQDKVRVAEALEQLPRLQRALHAGDIAWSAARELTRVATPQTEAAWLAAARGKTQRELELIVATRTAGDTPDTPARPAPRTRVLRFEVAPDTYATFREAMQRIQRQAGGGLDTDALLLAMARHALGGPRDSGRSSYQVTLDLCAACGHAAQRAAGDLVPVDPSVIEMAACDAQHLLQLGAAPELRAANENASPDPPQGSSSARPAPAARDSAARDPAARAPAATNASTAPHRGSSSRAHVGTPPPPAAAIAASAAPPGPAPIPRAKQSIPPAIRRAVLHRDRQRCRVPGCTHGTFVDVHHVQPRADGGRHELDNLITLCSAHHRATHRGELLIHPDPHAQFSFRHADGVPYGAPTDPRRIDAHAKVFSALRHLGFREGPIKAVLAALRADPELAEASVERLLREALCRIEPTGS